MLYRLTVHPFAAGAMATILLLLPLWLPLLTPVQALVPLPLFLVTLRAGNRAGWWAVLVLLLGAGVVGGGGVFPLVVFLLFAAFPLLAARLLRQGWQTSHCALIAFLLGNGVLVVILAITLVMGLDMPLLLSAEMNGMKEAVLTALGEQKMGSAALAEFRHTLEQIIAVVSLLLPAMVLTSWYLIQVANLLIARGVLLRWGEWGIAAEHLSAMRLPFPLVWAVIAMALLAVFAQGPWRFVGFNWGLFLAVPYFFQGLAILHRALQWYQVSHMLRVAVYTALFFWTSLVLLLFLVGLFDTWIDFRLRFFDHKEGENPSGR
ncbi:DUF2232 domain-containing protein [Candidatus Magnetaquicoccus inordinatus]|uniref:DUF2232 domain-containing protein n=1 Tax=Candidatus Magnetaquicoccus inordinatus TaxID=2496818 RepID=UPI00102B98D7|nr:DUF2232 domain-containing protein [Candidatus Magnetaquicoccus inordinatus]